MILGKKLKKDKEVEGQVKITDSKVFLKDPVAFGFLQDFQYGTGDEQEEGERQLFEELPGILIKDWELYSKDLKTLIRLAKEHPDDESRYLLYYNQGSMSHYVGNLLEQIGLSFAMRNVKSGSVNVHGERSPLPVLVDRKDGIPWDPTSVRGFARWYVLDKVRAEVPKFETFFGSSKEVTVFDQKGKTMYVGHISKSPLPVEKELRKNKNNYWCHVAAWDLGNFDDLLSQRGPYGEIVLPNSYLALFFDEIEQLKKEKEVVLNKHSCMYCGNFETAFISEDSAYRLQASFTD